MHLGKKYIVRKSHSKAAITTKDQQSCCNVGSRNKEIRDRTSKCKFMHLVLYWVKETNLLKWIKVGLRCSLNLLWHRKCHCKVQKIYWSMHFISLDVAMSCCTIFKTHDVYSVCFVITDLKSLTIYHAIYIHMCYKFLACESKIVSIFSGQFSGLPTELPTISILESSGLPTELHTELPTISVYGSGGQPDLHGKIPTALPTALPAVSIYGSSGQPTELPTELPIVSIHGSSGQPTERPTVSIYGSGGQPNLHGKIPMGSPLRCPRATHGQRSGHLPCFFRMGYFNKQHIYKNMSALFQSKI